ncbi:MAG: hypothetical protein AB1400_08845 [Pseudomonadota bacterium]
MTREPIYAALFNLLQNLPGIVTASRRLRHWNDVPRANQPALYMVQKSESAQTITGQPTKWLLRLNVYLYVNTADRTQSPAEVMNLLLDAISAALEPPPAIGKQTLGGLVYYCRIAGEIQTDEGALGDQSVAIIPVELLAV